MKRLLFAALFLASCQGGIVEGGNPPTRPVKGKLTTQTPCAADTAVSVDTSGAIVSVSIETEDCSFEFDLVPGKFWGLQFTDGGATVASTIFTTGEGTEDSAYYFLDDGDSALDFGLVTIEGSEATPENQPYNESDIDDDGTVDFEDADDDGDGVADGDEADCDGDGIIDDFDLSSSC